MDYVYVWADGIHVNVRLEEERLCLLVLVGVRADGTKELIALADGYRESAGSLGGPAARLPPGAGCAPPCSRSGTARWGSGPPCGEVFPQTREQRCWFHKTGNVLSALPKSAHPGAKKALAEIWNAEDKDHARAAAKAFAELYGAKWPKAVAKITDDLDELLAFYDYPAEHWVHLRTTNPIESTFATVRHRTKVTKGPGSKAAGLAIPVRSLKVELKTHVLFGHGDLSVLHHGVNTFQNAVDLVLDNILAAASHFIGMYCHLQVEFLFGISQQEKTKQNKGSGKNRSEVQASAHGHPYGSDHEQRGCRSDPGYQVATIVKNGASADETDAGNDLCRDTSVVAEMLDRQRVREQREHGCAEANEEIGPQPGGPMLELALQPDGASQDRCQYEAQQENSSCRHLELQHVPDVVNDLHGGASGWILSPGNLGLDGFRDWKGNAGDYRAETCVW